MRSGNLRLSCPGRRFAIKIVWTLVTHTDHGLRSLSTCELAESCKVHDADARDMIRNLINIRKDGQSAKSKVESYHT